MATRKKRVAKDSTPAAAASQFFLTPEVFRFAPATRRAASLLSAVHIREQGDGRTALVHHRSKQFLPKVRVCPSALPLADLSHARIYQKRKKRECINEKSFWGPKGGQSKEKIAFRTTPDLGLCAYTSSPSAGGFLRRVTDSMLRSASFRVEMKIALLFFFFVVVFTLHAAHHGVKRRTRKQAETKKERS